MRTVRRFVIQLVWSHRYSTTIAVVVADMCQNGNSGMIHSTDLLITSSVSSDQAVNALLGSQSPFSVVSDSEVTFTVAAPVNSPVQFNAVSFTVTGAQSYQIIAPEDSSNIITQTSITDPSAPTQVTVQFLHTLGRPLFVTYVTVSVQPADINTPVQVASLFIDACYTAGISLQLPYLYCAEYDQLSSKRIKYNS